MSRLRRASRAVLFLGCLLSLSTCTPDTASIAIEVSPNPISFVGFNAGHGRITWTATWNVTVRETAGRGGDVTLVETTVENVADGLALDTITADAAAIRASQGTNHLPGHGSLTIQQTWVETDIFYFACNEFAFRVAVTFVDENGHTLMAVMRVPEAPRTRPCPSP
jgi:hypothetical protein